MSTIRKKEIDLKISTMYDLSGTGVSVEDITHEFLHQVMRQLVAGHEVYLRGFGIFKVSIRSGRQQKTVLTKGTFKKGERAGTTTVTVDKKYYVSFRRAVAFREMFRERFGKPKPKGEKK